MLGDLFRVSRERLGLKKSEVAQRVGIDASNYGRIESNELVGKPATLAAIARELQIEPAVLFDAILNGYDAPASSTRASPLGELHERVARLESVIARMDQQRESSGSKSGADASVRRLETALVGAWRN